MAELELSVVIPTIGRGERLRRALECLERQHASGRFEVVVAVDAAASDEDVEATAEPRPYPSRVVRADAAGAAGARNAGLRSASAPLVLFLDDDVLADRELIGEHLAWHGRAPEVEVGVLGDVRWASELRVTPFMRWLEDGIQFDYPNIEGTEAGWGRFYTANVSVKRELVERVGGFDERRFPFGHEDLDLAYRMSRHGFRLLYNRDAGAEHLHPMDLDFWRRRVRRIAASERRFCTVHPDVRPYFHDLLRHHLDAPPPRGLGARLAAIVPRRVPVLGERAWRSADAVYRHELAPPFFDAWNAAAAEADDVAPDLGERRLSGR